MERPFGFGLVNLKEPDSLNRFICSARNGRSSYIRFNGFYDVSIRTGTVLKFLLIQEQFFIISIVLTIQEKQ